jgi:hypothetical protein
MLVITSAATFNLLWNWLGKNKLKFETVSYQEMVGSRIKQINEDSQMLVTYKNRFAAEHMQSQALAESLCRLSEKLKKTVQENRIVRERTKLLHEQTKEEVTSLNCKLLLLFLFLIVHLSLSRMCSHRCFNLLPIKHFNFFWCLSLL